MRLKYFGTDGIRGVVDKKMTSSLAYNIGQSLAINIIQKGMVKRVLIGKDTRISGDMLTYSIACGLIDYGVEVLYLGIVPTGCVSYLSSKQAVAYGVMITASHNSAEMNGIKIISNLGYKLSKDEEIEIEKIMDSQDKLPPVYYKGSIINSEKLVNKYITFITNNSPRLDGVKIALDCANGSNYSIAPKMYRSLGAEVVEIGTDNKGDKINDNCGSQHPQQLVQEVIMHKCDIGFAFDGDADRLVVITNKGKHLGGDELLYIFAKYLMNIDELNSLTVVGTIMTNKGCELSLKELGVNLVRVDVGDRNIIEMMHKNNYSLGGETSGHICMHKYNTTCDALMNSLQLLKIIDGDFSYIETALLPYKKQEQLIKNVKVSDEFRESFGYNQKFEKALEVIKSKHSDCKIVVRPSGTESVIRILVESKDNTYNVKMVGIIEKLIREYMIDA